MSLLANSNAIETGGYQISRSVRLRSSASAYFNRTPASATNRQTWTWSGWIKRGVLGSQCDLFCGDSSTTISEINIGSDDTLKFWQSGTTLARQSTAVFRDPSAWYHIVVVLDTTNATAQNRCRMYVNGVEITTWTTNNTITQNAQFGINTATAHNLGRSTAANIYFDGYLTEINFIDGQALTPSSFGETNSITGVWQPKKYAGTYGTNGFYLNFSDNSAATAAAIGKDYSGNGNNWTPNNINVSAYTGTPPNNTSYDSMLDVPSGSGYADGGNGRGNYAVMNPLDRGSSYYPTLSQGNLYYVAANNTQNPSRSTLSVTTGKFYFEATIVTKAYNPMVGVMTISSSLGTGDNFKSLWGTQAAGWSSFTGGSNGIVSNGTNSSYGTAMAPGDVIMVAFDVDNGKFYVGKNGTWNDSANPSAGTGNQATFTHTDPITPFFDGTYTGGSGDTWAVNFGQRPFTYTPPTGFKALNTQNLPDATIKKGNQYFDVSVWTGTGVAQNIVNSGSMKPDFVWIKARNQTYDNQVWDSVRGALLKLATNQTFAESSLANSVTGFNSNGIALGDTATVNLNTGTFVGWQWQAGQGTTSSNTAGSITSTVSANTTSGFSIVTYTGNGSSSATVGHGLGVAPSMIIVKARSGGSDWEVFHTSLGASYGIRLDTTAAKIAASSTAGGIINTSPTSTTFGFTAGTSNVNNVNENGVTWVAYCFAEVAGYSKFGSWTGNGSTDGPFVYLGFKPAFVLLKRTDSTSNWTVRDNKRAGYNDDNDYLCANLSDAEANGSTYPVDLLSNGFKFRTTDGNISGGAYIYAAFAENPLKFSNAR